MTRPWDDLDALVAAVEGEASHLGSTIHGPDHWRAVGATAAELAGVGEGAAAPAPDHELLLLFALLHDAKREDDGYDREHGPRAAILLDQLRADGVLRLSDERAAVLAEALRDHTNGTCSEQPTIAVCWDADRLLIGRVGLIPDARFCSTADGRRRATAGDLPELIGPPSWHDVAALLGVGPGPG